MKTKCKTKFTAKLNEQEYDAFKKLLYVLFEDISDKKRSKLLNEEDEAILSDIYMSF